MSDEAARVLEAALKLPSEARAALAAVLMDSLVEVDPDVEAAWATEIQRRVADLEAGTVETIPWEEARRIIEGR